MRSSRSTRIVCLAAMMLALCLTSKNWTLTVVQQGGAEMVKMRTRISEAEVLAAQKGWGDALVQLSATYEKSGFDAAKALAEKIIDAAYGYNYGAVLFKPTLAGGEQTFRTTREGALAYFVGGNPSFPNDKGFGIKGWRKVEFVNKAIFRSGNLALSVGNVMFTDKSGTVTTVDKTFAFYKGWDRKLRIVAHHSSLPFSG